MKNFVTLPEQKIVDIFRSLDSFGRKRIHWTEICNFILNNQTSEYTVEKSVYFSIFKKLKFN